MRYQRNPSPHRRTEASAGIKLLLVLSLALCALVAIQWSQEVKLKARIAETYRDLTGLETQKRNLEQSSARVEEELKRVEMLRTRLQEQDVTNKQELLQLRKDSVELRLDNQRLTKQSDAFQAAYEKQKAITEEANRSIQQAGDAVKRLATERDSLVAKYNELATKQETLIKQYNTLADYVKKLQEAATPGAEKEKK